MMKFCERLKELRKENNLTTTQLGKILGVSNSTITRWENENILPSIEHLYNMAIYFKVSADYLIGLED
ncbi:MAG: helix-turn-helix transcriptional regulator [Clostridia bacterium]|nr:helix-turn-helix transcriptional regulator [Clostridia bacterium]